MRPRARPAALAIMLMVSAAGCRAAPQHYDQGAEDRLSAAGPTGQRIRLDARIDGDWWSIFGSPKLDDVVRHAVAGNPDLEAADARIAQARDAVAVARGGLRPQVDLVAAGGRERSAIGAHTSSFYAIGPQVSFDFDLFGGTRRLVEQQSAIARLAQHRFDAAYLTLTGSVARQAILLASARAQLDAVELLIADDRRTLELVQAAHRHGSVTQVDEALATSQLAQDQTLLPPLAQQRDVALHALSILAGQGPADWISPVFDLANFTLPTELPVSLPSDLARDRPDILAAEAELDAASASIGIATADLYPQLRVSASLSRAGVGSGVDTLWGIAAGLAAPIFHGGSLKANRAAAVDGYRATLADYRQTIVEALGQIADILQSIDHDGEEYAAQQRALDAAESSLRLNRGGYGAGEIGVLQVLDAERAYQRALLGQIRARTARYLDVVDLSVALGGNTNGAFAHSRVAAK